MDHLVWKYCKLRPYESVPEDEQTIYADGDADGKTRSGANVHVEEVGSDGHNYVYTDAQDEDVHVYV